MMLAGLSSSAVLGAIVVLRAELILGISLAYLVIVLEKNILEGWYFFN